MWRSHRGCRLDGKRAQTPQVFVRDTELNTTTRLSALDGTHRSAATDASSHSSDFRSRLAHIFLADLQTGTTRIITNSARRGLANGASAKPKVSSDGRFVAFQSEASDLVATEDFNLLWDVFVFDRITGAITRVSGDPAKCGWSRVAVRRSTDADPSSPSRRATRPTRRTRGMTSISTWRRLQSATRRLGGLA